MAWIPALLAIIVALLGAGWLVRRRAARAAGLLERTRSDELLVQPRPGLDPEQTLQQALRAEQAGDCETAAQLYESIGMLTRATALFRAAGNISKVAELELMAMELGRLARDMPTPGEPSRVPPTRAAQSLLASLASWRAPRFSSRPPERGLEGAASEAGVMVTHRPGAASEWPSPDSDFAEVVSDFPAAVSDFPAVVSDFPAVVSDFPAVVSDFPAVVSNFPGLITEPPSGRPSAFSDVPRALSEAPAAHAARRAVSDLPRAVSERPRMPTIDQLRAMLGRSPTPDLGNIEIYYRLGLALLAGKQLDEARRAFTTVEEISPGYRDADMYLQELAREPSQVAAAPKWAAPDNANGRTAPAIPQTAPRRRQAPVEEVVVTSRRSDKR